MAEKTTTINGILVRGGASIISSDKFTNKILERFEKEETFLNKSGQRFTDNFRRLLRRQMGLKEDYMQLSHEKKIAEARKRILEDFKVAREEIKNRNPVDYLLDRALDPLDPMNVVYKIILEILGAKIDEHKKAIRLTPQLKAILFNSSGYLTVNKSKEAKDEQVRRKI